MAGIEGIKISTAQVTSAASTIRTLNTSLTETLMNIKKQMNSLTSTWQSESCDTIQAKMNGMQPKFEEYKAVIESYAKFLDTTVASYEATETAINSNASAFQ